MIGISKRFLPFLLSSILFFPMNIFAFGKNAVIVPRTNLSGATNTFGLFLLKKMISMYEDDNIVISPVSISAALSMTLNGATGKTLKSMKKTLAFESFSPEEINLYYQNLIKTLPSLDKKVTVSINNAIWYRQDLAVRQEFQKTLEKYYMAKIQSADFQSGKVVEKINRWVKKSTRGKISSIIDRVNPLDVMYLLNAVYFKGSWHFPFDPKLTRKDDFFSTGGEKIKCDMMNITKSLPYFENSSIQMVQLPYGAEHFSMFVVLPRENISLDHVTEKPDSIFSWMKKVKENRVALSMPKFKIEYKKSLKEVLSKLGMKNAFTSQADFSNMVEKGEINISDVKHKTFIEVNEEGTEAAAVTGVTMVLSAVRPMQTFRMNVNRPFLFFIAENESSAILFMGKIGKPE